MCSPCWRDGLLRLPKEAAEEGLAFQSRASSTGSWMMARSKRSPWRREPIAHLPDPDFCQPELSDAQRAAGDAKKADGGWRAFTVATARWRHRLRQDRSLFLSESSQGDLPFSMLVLNIPEQHVSTRRRCCIFLSGGIDPIRSDRKTGIGNCESVPMKGVSPIPSLFASYRKPGI